MLIVVIVGATTSHANALHPRDTQTYDVIIAGGSTAALAAALTAAHEGAAVALIEPTDWPGGQLTSSGVPAVDEAWHKISDPQTGNVLLDVAAIARDPANMTPRFRDMLLRTGNPGRGWVSRFCFEPQKFLDGELKPAIAAAGDKLTVIHNAVLKEVAVDSTGRRILSVSIVVREPRSGVAWRGYDRLPSTDLADWYDPNDSERFTKRVVRIEGSTPAAVFLDATEWGELLALADAPYLQGTESGHAEPQESEVCGQSTVFGFVQELHAEPQDDVSPQINVGHLGWGMYHDMRDRWEKIWTYRRLRGSQAAPGPGDLSLQNWGYAVRLKNGGNDYPFGYLFLSREKTSEQRDNWQGGVDLNVMAAAERRALGWHAWFREQVPEPFTPEQITLARGMLGTGHGLSMLPYIRDTRRSIGLDGFLLQFEDLTGAAAERTGRRFADRIALGAYPADVHALSSCKYPQRVFEVHDTLPFYIPFRALTNKAYDNLLVAGKTMAQTFLANSATRLHPIEWSAGTAAGAAATMMTKRKWTARDAYEHVEEVQAQVKKHTPIDWNLH